MKGRPEGVGRRRLLGSHRLLPAASVHRAGLTQVKQACKDIKSCCELKEVCVTYKLEKEGALGVGLSASHSSRKCLFLGPSLEVWNEPLLSSTTTAFCLL